MKVGILAPNLHRGGAERQMVALAGRLKQRGSDVVMLVIDGGGALEEDVVRAGVPLEVLGRSFRFDPLLVLRLARLLRRERIEVLYCGLDVANVVGWLARRLHPRIGLVWTIRASDLDLSRYTTGDRLLWRLQRRLAKSVPAIVCNSEAGRRHATAAGFPQGGMSVIPNGIDCVRFRPDQDARRRVRSEWGVADDEMVVGIAARLDPTKDHDTFLAAAARLASIRPDVHFVCAGGGPEDRQRLLRKKADDLKLAGRLRWLGLRDDMPAVYCGFDLGTLSSTSEGLPNGLAEAMACGVPVVSTDVGDCRELVGDTGLIVSPSSAEELADAWARMLVRVAEEGRGPSEAARARVCERYGLDALAERTEAVLRSTSEAGGSG